MKLSRYAPSECTVDEIEAFSDLVSRAFGSRDRTGEIARARCLVFLAEGDEIVGVAALKAPTEGECRRAFRNAGVSPPEVDVPCELGWVVVEGHHRGRRYSRALVESALQAVGNAGVFATSHDTNTPMHRTLQRYGFTRAGAPYHSQRHGTELMLFVRRGDRTDP